ncbi:alkaline phosphatase family protein [Microcella daejeonensis]|uniref:alkaline phosphatase family protein n=1 Tax=Microcella daejeonensis TaxID=2994971 RepID=UPI00226E8D93|nr:nucleotide pyrophosphatase/phosphodiesterase family protein [Microcella daejeonensis]WAB83314.1 alkaline phosphatase family protein [Microcella daejeonensis]
MLPARQAQTPSLRHVLAGASASLSGGDPLLRLPRARSAAVVLVDGLGSAPLAARAGHARRILAAVPKKGGSIHSGFPSTTASALASLTTGLLPGEHGLTGYSAVDARHDRVVTVLSDWDERMQPRDWQPHPTLFETATADGVEAVVIAPERYRSTGFTEAVLRGARFVPAATIADRIDAAVGELAAPGRRLVYVYIPELDSAGHAHGAASEQWLHRLEELDAALAPLERRLPHDAGVLLTADHGMIDVPEHRRLVIATDDPVWEGVRHVAGEPRCLQLALEGDADLEAARARWQAAEGARSWVVTRQEAIDAGWFGAVSAAVLPRIGDLLIAARSAVAYYDERTATPRSLAMVGQHGSLSAEETRIPLARWGVYAP